MSNQRSSIYPRIHYHVVELMLIWFLFEGVGHILTKTGPEIGDHSRCSSSSVSAVEVWGTVVLYSKRNSNPDSTVPEYLPHRILVRLDAGQVAAFNLDKDGLDFAGVDFDDAEVRLSPRK